MTITQNTLQTRQESRYGALTPEQVQRYGYTPIPTYPGSRAIASCWKPGYGIDVAAGLQADGSYLHLLDLDSHTPEQDAQAQLDRIRRRLGPDLYGRLAIRLSRSGRGYHIIYRTTTPHSQQAYIKVFDPLQPDRHIGELIGPGMRVTLTGEWIQGGPEAIPLLTASELSLLRAAIHTPALYAPQDAPAGSQDAPESRAPRKERMAEGLSLIAGWERVSDVQQRLETLAQRKPHLEQHLREMRRTPDDRSEAYSQLIQSLMYHAATLGRNLKERCRVVAALAIHVGAAGKECERTYKIIQDTAVLIARIIHGDQFLNSDHHFGIPHWVNGNHIPERPATPTRAQSAERTPHPHAHNRQKNIKKLVRYVSKLPSDEYGKHHTSLDDLAELLGVSRRAISSYLKELREQGAIYSGQDGGNGSLYIIVREPLKTPKNPRRHAQSIANEPHTTTENHSDRVEKAAPESAAPTPNTQPADPVCIEELGPPKGCDPAPLPAGLPSSLLVEAPDRSIAVMGRAREYPPPPDDLAVSGAPADELHGPAGAFAIVGGAAYVPSGAEPWYAGICAAIRVAAPDQADKVAGAMQLVAPLDQQVDDQADSCGASYERVGDDQAGQGGASYGRAADQIAHPPDKRKRRRRTCKDPKRKKLDEQRRRIEGWRAMDLGELLVERAKLAGASHDPERSPQQRQLLANMLPQIDVEIGRKRSAGLQAMYQASGNSSEPPPAVEQAAPVPGVVRRAWRSGFVPFDTPTETLPPREVVPRTHPIADLGTDPESMRAAHEYCERIMAGLRARGEA